MHTLRLSAAAPALVLALSSPLVIAWSVGAASCGTAYTFACGEPDGSFIGAGDSNDNACPCVNSCCLSGPPNGQPYPQRGVGTVNGICAPADAGPMGACGAGTVLVGGECVVADSGGDAGDPADAAEDGPLPTCDGQCWPLPPEPNWTGPLLLGVGGDGGLLACPDVGTSAAVWAGSGAGTSAIACNSTASGTCMDLVHVCGPEGDPNFLTCVMQTGDIACPLVAPYVERQLFYETAVPGSLPATTFCCLGAPDAGAPDGGSSQTQ